MMGLVENCIITECYCDALLTRVCGYESAEVHSGIGTIANLMIEGPYRLKRAIGIIDDDKLKPMYFDDFVQIHRASNSRIRLCKKEGTGHFIIVLEPDAEEWILKAAISAEVNPRSYGFSSTVQGLKERTKREAISKDVQFRNFLNAIAQKNPIQFRALKKYIHIALNFDLHRPRPAKRAIKKVKK